MSKQDRQTAWARLDRADREVTAAQCDLREESCAQDRAYALRRLGGALLARDDCRRSLWVLERSGQAEELS